MSTRIKRNIYLTHELLRNMDNIDNNNDNKSYNIDNSYHNQCRIFCSDFLNIAIPLSIFGLGVFLMIILI